MAAAGKGSRGGRQGKGREGGSEPASERGEGGGWRGGLSGGCRAKASLGSRQPPPPHHPRAAGGGAAPPPPLAGARPMGLTRPLRLPACLPRRSASSPPPPSLRPGGEGRGGGGRPSPRSSSSPRNRRRPPTPPGRAPAAGAGLVPHASPRRSLTSSGERPPGPTAAAPLPARRAEGPPRSATLRSPVRGEGGAGRTEGVWGGGSPPRASPPGPASPPSELPSARRGSARRPGPPAAAAAAAPLRPPARPAPGPEGGVSGPPARPGPGRPGGGVPHRPLDPGVWYAVPREVMWPLLTGPCGKPPSLRSLVPGAWTIYPHKPGARPRRPAFRPLGKGRALVNLLGCHQQASPAKAGGASPLTRRSELPLVPAEYQLIK